METSKSRSNDANKKNNQVVTVPPSISSHITETMRIILKTCFPIPLDLLLPVVVNNRIGASIISVNSTKDELKVMSRLSKTCKSFYFLYQPELEKRAAKKLLECFFLPTETNVKKAMAMLKANPKLAFVKIENDKTITDIRHRCFEGSLLQAAMQMRTIGWYNWLRKEVIEKTNSEAEATKQYQEKFGQPDIRKERMLAQIDIDLKAIEDAFINDPCTNGKPTLQATLDAFEKMRQHFAEENQPGMVIKTGEFFPIEILQKIYGSYRKHWGDHSWIDNQLSCYSKLMIGFALRFFSADDFLRLLKGLQNIKDEEVPLFGDFKLTVINNNRQYDLDFINLDKYPDFRPGFDWFVDVYHGPCEGEYVRAPAHVVRTIENVLFYMSNRDIKLPELSSNTQLQSGADVPLSKKMKLVVGQTQ